VQLSIWSEGGPSPVVADPVDAGYWSIDEPVPRAVKYADTDGPGTTFADTSRRRVWILQVWHRKPALAGQLLVVTGPAGCEFNEQRLEGGNGFRAAEISQNQMEKILMKRGIGRLDRSRHAAGIRNSPTGQAGRLSPGFV
jgi:hypothetical protein